MFAIVPTATRSIGRKTEIAMETANAVPVAQSIPGLSCRTHNYRHITGFACASSGEHGYEMNRCPGNTPAPIDDDAARKMPGGHWFT